MEPFLGEIRLMSFPFNPKAWAQCNGQTMPIAQNQALFSLLGTTYGGNGQTTFMLPDLRGRVPISQGDSRQMGQNGGEATHTLTIQEMAAHQHQLSGTASDSNNTLIPANALLAKAAPANPYVATASLAPMIDGTIASVGNSQPHENMQPYLTMNYCIALQGIFPSRN